MKRLLQFSLTIATILALIISCAKEEPTPDPIKYTLTVSAGDGGNVSSTGGSYTAGSEVTITATPNSEYVFSGWSNGSTENPIKVTVNSNQTLTANFTKRKYALSITIEGEGTVTEEVISSGKDYNSGTVVRLTAVPSDNWQFNGWTGAVESTELSIDLTISEAKSITANFGVTQYDYIISRHTISIPINEFPSIQHLTNTISDISGGFVVNTANNIYFFRGGVTGNESVGSIDEVDPSPSVILQKKDGKWDLLRVDKSIYTWVVRNYAIDGDLITIGDGNEIGPNEVNDRWKGDVWQGKIDDNGDISWVRVTTDESRSYHHGIATGDLNGDGLIDISSGPRYYDPLTDNFGQSIWLNNGDGTFEWNTDLIPQDAPAPFGLAFANVTGDSRDEIILGGNAYGLGSPNYIHIYKQITGQKGFELFTKLEDNTLWDYGMFTTKIETFDFNNDNNLDIIQYQADDSGEGFDIWVGNGSGGFSPYFSKLFPGSTLSSSEFEVFDANNDGYLDVLLRPNGYNSSFRVNPTEYRTDVTNGIILNNLIWLNDGSGKFNSFNQFDLTLNKEIEGKSFHPKYVVPFMENNELHFLGVEANFSFIEDKIEFPVYDIKVIIQ